MDDSTADKPPTDDPAIEASRRLAAAVRQMVDDVTAVAKQASDKIGDNGNDDTYTAGDLFGTMAKLANATLAGGLRLAATAFEVRPRRPSDNLMVMADHMASIAKRTVEQAKAVTEDASERIADDPKDLDAWVKSMTKLADIALISGIEFAETAVIGPTKYARPRFISDPFTADRAPYRRKLKAVGLKRPQTVEVIDDRIRFDPEYLEAGATEFRMVVDETNLPSGVYVGEVYLGDDPSPVPVAIRL